MKFVVYICFRISFAYFACQEYIQSFNSFGRQSHDWRHWFRLWNLTPLNISTQLYNDIILINYLTNFQLEILFYVHTQN